MDKIDGIGLGELIDRLYTPEGKEIVRAWFTGVSMYLKLDVQNLRVRAQWFVVSGDECIKKGDEKAAHSMYIGAFRHFEMVGMFSNAYELAKRIGYTKEKEMYKHLREISIPYGR